MKTCLGTRHCGVINAADAGSVPADPAMNLPGGGNDADATATAAAAVMRALEGRQLHLPRAAVLEIVSTRTRLLADFAAHRALTGDHEVARAARAGDGGQGQPQLRPRHERTNEADEQGPWFSHRLFSTR